MTTPKKRFLKMVESLPKEARTGLVYNFHRGNPYSLLVCYYEVKNDTKLGDKVLRELGYVEEAKE